MSNYLTSQEILEFVEDNIDTIVSDGNQGGFIQFVQRLNECPDFTSNIFLDNRNRTNIQWTYENTAGVRVIFLIFRAGWAVKLESSDGKSIVYTNSITTCPLRGDSIVNASNISFFSKWVDRLP